MAITTLKGIVKEVLPVEYYGETRTGRRQTLVLFVPGYVNEYQEKVTRDETWGIEIYNKKIDDFALNTNCVSKKAEIEIYLSGREWEKEDKKGFSISATLKSIKLGETARLPQPVGASENPNADDGLPF